jgi:hypothetical protein
MTYDSGVVRRPLLLLVVSLCLLLSSCFKAHNGALEQGPSITIEISPSSITLNPGQTQNIAAVVYDPAGQGVTWTATPVSFGTLSNLSSSSVTYTAPANIATPTTVTITATSVSNPNITASSKVKVTPVISLYVANSNTQQNFYSSQNINQGEQIEVLANPPNGNYTGFAVQWSLSPASGAGSLTSAATTNVMYVAPTTVTSPTTVTVSAQITGSSATGSLQITVFPSGAAANVAMMAVNGGPVPGQVYPNAAFTSVTLCNPGTSTCQTVGGILVDTGSSGLRILQSEIPQLSLPTISDGNGNTLQNCDLQVDGSYLWGPVSLADLYISGEATTQAASIGLPIQVITSSTLPAPSSCSNGGSNENTAQLLGANGILGIGPEPTDCTIAGINYCNGSNQPVPPNIYYSCPSTGCGDGDLPVLISSTQQVSNPIPLFGVLGAPSDNNGVILQFPSVSGTENNVTGSMTFGIGTESNNFLQGQTVYTLDSADHFTTSYNGQTLTSSFIDTGSNALYFPDTQPVCTVNSQYYCPASLTSLDATNTGATQGQGIIDFSVDNADSLLSTSPSDAVFGTLAGPLGTYNTCSDGQGSCTFEWGLPFFYGRSVYVAIDSFSSGVRNSTAGVQTPWWAY